MGTLMENLQDRIQDAVNSTGTFDESLQKLADLYGMPTGSNPARLVSVAAEFEPSITGAPAALNYLLNNPSKLPTLGLDFINNTTLDSRITFTRALNTATYFDSAGVLQTATANTPRFDYNPSTLAARGLLIEESRTNSIRNNTMQGAVAGTPGTLPTNWANDLVGTTREVVNAGTANGINYVDIRFSGTPTSTTDLAIYPELTTGVAATNSQTWAISAWISIVAGSLSNIGTTRLRVDQFSSVPAFLSTLGAGTISLTSSLTRFTGTITTNNASTAYVRPGIGLSVTSGQAIDITLRIGLPQLELGAFATSVIPTTGSAATRNADAASITGANFSSWYNATEGTLFAEINCPTALSPQTFASLDLSAATRMTLHNNAGSGYWFVRDNNVTQAGVTNGTISSGVTIKIAGAYATNSFNLSTNGGIGTEDTSGSVPSGLTRLSLGSYTTSALNPLNGYLRRITYYPRRLSNAELQAITS